VSRRHRPSLGAASVRVQSMRGRYTRFLSDGLPLFGEEVGGLGLLQIPPTDLGQVEVIKGVASALYGAGALGGVVDLISRRPGRFRVFVNVENIGNVRQTDRDPLIRPVRAADGRWTVDAWAPLDGRVLNGGVRVQF
jgi:outer membrane receptor protein involved in Fe transport